MGKIVWIASYPKSGNTWMRFFLYAYFTLETREIDEIDINSDSFTRMFAQDLDRRLFEHRIDKPWDALTMADVAPLRAAAQRELAAQRSGLILGKTHTALVGHLGHPTINAAVMAGAIYIVRNPLDLVDSVMNHYGVDSVDKAVRFLNNDAQVINKSDALAHSLICSWRRNVESWTGTPRAGIVAIRYEDMLKKPVNTFSRVIRHLGQPLDERRLRRALELTSFSRLQAREAETGFVEGSKRAERFFRSGTAGRWRNILTDQQVAEMVGFNRKPMGRFGYLPK